tara:strand:+ start:7874 stop:8491 length:618 start_codon:yes stop_codon:yes gene_type:complete
MDRGSKESNTWKSIQKLSGEPGSKTMDSNILLAGMGIDADMAQLIEDQAVNAAMEDVKVKVNFKNVSSNPDPTHKYLDDSGMDLRANLQDELVIAPWERGMVPTGLSFELPESYEIQVRPRSGLAAKKGITVLNTPGTVDRGYNGEIIVILVNLSNQPFTIKNGDRIAQAVISPVISGRWCKLTKKNTLSNTNRGDGGFGSTGIE